MNEQLQVRADVDAAIKPPAGPDTNADSSAGSELKVDTLKGQGKVYRSDIYTIHWKAEGHGQPLHVNITISGACNWSVTWLPLEGQVTLTRAYMMYPPNYSPPNDTEYLIARIDATDCMGNSVYNENKVNRP